MKVFQITLSLLLAASNFNYCDAFGPSSVSSASSRTHSSSALYAKTLEGWKVDGKVKPVNNFILVKTADTQTKTETGILLSDSAKIVKTEGTVVEVGPGKPHPDSGIPFPMPVEEGDGLVYGKYDGTELNIDGVTHSLIRDDDILVRFKSDDEGESITQDNVVAVNDSVLVSVQTRESETSGGLFLASGSSDDNKRPSTGTVVKVGPGRMAASGALMPMSVEVGDQVKFMDYAGNEIKIGEVEYSVVKMPEILAKF